MKKSRTSTQPTKTLSGFGLQWVRDEDSRRFPDKETSNIQRRTSNTGRAKAMSSRCLAPSPAVPLRRTVDHRTPQCWPAIQKPHGSQHKAALSNFGFSKWRHYTSDATTVLILLLTAFVHAQDSQFHFDANGNLTAQTAAASAMPEIIGQPQNRMVAPGETASFSVVVSDPRDMTYVWSHNGVPLAGVDNDSLTVLNANANNEGEYRVVLTNPSGSVTSAPALLMIDSDHDGIADSWELAYFGSLTNTGSGDFDLDGVSNLQELLDGTNPTNSASVRYHLTLVQDGGSVAVTPNLSSYTNGQTVTLTATPFSNGSFHAWLGDVVTQSNTITLMMTTNKTVYAHFTPVVFTWAGPLSGDWNAATNWEPRLVPGSNDSVVLNTGSTVILDTAADCASVVLGGPNILGGPGNSNPTLTGSGTLTVHDHMYWRSGGMSGSGRTVLESGATLILDMDNPAGLSLSSRTLELGGETFWTAATDFFLNNGVITNRLGAVFHAAGSGSINSSGRFDNAGTFRKSGSTGTTTFTGGANFNNYGTVAVENGGLHFDGSSLTNNGAVNVSGGATLRLGGGGAGNGTINAAATALVEWTFRTFTLESGAQLNGSGHYQINAGSPFNQQLTTLSNYADIVVEDFGLLYGVLAGPGKFTVTNAMDWTGGTMSGSGQTIIPPGATLTIANTNAVTLGQTLENGGTILWTGAGDIGMSAGAIITNRAGALFDVRSAAGLGGGIANGRLDNAGTFRKSANPGITTFQSGMILNNFGSVEIEAGTLRLAGNGSAESGSATGTFDAAPATLVEWTGGTFALNAGAQLNGAGLYRINGFGATLAANTGISVENFDLLSGTLGGSAPITISKAMNWTGGTMSGSGKTIIPSGTMLTISNPSPVTLTRTLENGGTVLWTGAGDIGMNAGAVITNRAGALFDAQSAASLSAGSGANRFDNAGAFRKSVSSGTMQLGSGVSFNNSGTVDIRSGILAANGGYNSSPNSLLNCVLGGTTAGTGYGQLQKSGTVTLDGALSVELLPGFTPATYDAFTVVTAGTRNGTFANFNYPSNAVTMQLSNSPNAAIVRVAEVFGSAFQPVLLLPQIDGTNFRLTWTTVSNTVYRVEFNPNLAASNWTALPGDVTATSNTASKLDALTASNRFYRVHVLP